VKFVNLFATWQHLFDVPVYSSFLSCHASSSLVQFRPLCYQFIYLVVVITSRRFYRNPFSVLVRSERSADVGTSRRDNGTQWNHRLIR